LLRLVRAFTHVLKGLGFVIGGADAGLGLIERGSRASEAGQLEIGGGLIVLAAGLLTGFDELLTLIRMLRRSDPNGV
jgi:hypothetical protein